ncbi:uncharacterized protein LOC141612520 [Silene latifolia]|uniref:uncharacterized protein LOC141612520 n=1 Tax=Silene latifolia TaxID=37657 RepID=UPI003D772C67
MALADSSSPSLSPCSDDLVLPDCIKILGITDDDDLLQYGMNTTTTLVKNIGYTSGSAVALVGNLVYVVGGHDNNDFPTSLVVFYDITESSISLPLAKHQGPSLNSPKFVPKLIVMGSKLFAFSRRFLRDMPCPNPSSLYQSSPLAAPESLPICEFLDTSSPFNKWCSITSFPILPPPKTKGLHAYAISSYAVQPNKDVLFLSFGLRFDSVGVFSISYNHSLDFWTNVHPLPLPFVGEGQFIDDVCFGFPCGMDTHYRIRDYVVSYRVIVEYDCADTFQFIPLAKYSLLSNSTLTNYPTLFSFQLVSSRILTTIRVKPHHYSSDYSLELEVLELLPLKVEKKQVEDMEEIILHPSHVCSTTTYTMYDHHFRAIVGAYW